MGDEGDEDRLIAGRYRLISRLGRGGMGEVWQAYDERLHRRVAVKQLLMPPELTGSQSEQAMRRAVREGRAAARLQHKNAISIFDVDEEFGRAYLVMEYLPSSSLSQVLAERGTMPPDEVAAMGTQLADALAAAHAAGVVHRDVKPGNVLLADDGTAKITDFGISRALEDTPPTISAHILGTPAYLAPEVAKGEPATFRSDVYSLGATLCTAIEGAPPSGSSDNPMALLFRIASGDIDEPSHAGPMTEILVRMLDTEPDRRPEMTEVRDVLAALPATPPAVVPAPPPPVETPAPTETPEAETPAPVETPAEPAVEPAVETKAEAPVETPVQAPAPVAPSPDDLTVPVAPQKQKQKKKRPVGLLVGLAALLAIAGGLLVYLLNNDSNDPATGDTALPPAETSSVAPPPPSEVPADETTDPVTPPSASNPASVPAGPGTPATVVQQVSGAAVITDYYGLMPGNLDEGWIRMTPKYQQNTAGGRGGYERYWGQMSGVRVSGVTERSPSVVEATVEYDFKSGKVVREQHRYQLVQQDGRWKIDQHTVLSSRTIRAGANG